jgi:hypothetical protein
MEYADMLQSDPDGLQSHVRFTSSVSEPFHVYPNLEHMIDQLGIEGVAALMESLDEQLRDAPTEQPVVYMTNAKADGHSFKKIDENKMRVLFNPDKVAILRMFKWLYHAMKKMYEYPAFTYVTNKSAHYRRMARALVDRLTMVWDIVSLDQTVSREDLIVTLKMICRLGQLQKWQEDYILSVHVDNVVVDPHQLMHAHNGGIMSGSYLTSLMGTLYCFALQVQVMCDLRRDMPPADIVTFLLNPGSEPRRSGCGDDGRMQMTSVEASDWDFPPALWISTFQKFGHDIKLPTRKINGVETVWFDRDGGFLGEEMLLSKKRGHLSVPLEPSRRFRALMWLKPNTDRTDEAEIATGVISSSWALWWLHTHPDDLNHFPTMRPVMQQWEPIWEYFKGLEQFGLKYPDVNTMESYMARRIQAFESSGSRVEARNPAFNRVNRMQLTNRMLTTKEDTFRVALTVQYRLMVGAGWFPTPKGNMVSREGDELWRINCHNCLSNRYTSEPSEWNRGCYCTLPRDGHRAYSKHLARHEEEVFNAIRVADQLLVDAQLL